MKNPIKRAVSLICALALCIGLLPTASFAANEPSTAKTANASTLTSYLQSLGNNTSTRYAGRVWTDKTVSTEGIEFKNENGNTLYTIENDSDFLIAYSALATSQQITRLPKIPVDVVFVLDLSASMNWGMQSEEVQGENNQDGQKNSRLQAMVNSLNDSIDLLVNDNENNRIGIVTFNGSSGTLLDLTTAKDIKNISDKQYLEIASFKLTSSSSGGKQEADATIRCNINNRTAKTAGGTNIQAGLDSGMRMLSGVSETTYQYLDHIYTRIPNVVLMSDGAPTTFASANTTYYDEQNDQKTGYVTKETDLSETYYNQNKNPLSSGEWWNGVGPDAIGSGDTATPDSADGFMALLTASYLKQSITNHYQEKTDTLENKEQAQAHVYTIGFSTDYQTESMSAMAELVLNPEDNWNADQTFKDQNEKKKWETTFDELDEAWDNYQNSRTVLVSGKMGTSSTYPDQYQVKKADLTLSSLNYPDAYYPADSASSLQDAFKQITNTITESAKAPTEISNNDPVHSGYISYSDPIGEYMEVKDVKAIIWNGEIFEKKSTSTSGNTETYRFEGQIDSPVYGTHQLSEIEISVETTKTGDDTERQTLHVNIPASVIPIRVNEIEIEADNTIKSNTSNEAYPIRVLYTVGIQSSLLENGTVDKAKISSDYLTENMDQNGQIAFYSNLYSENPKNGSTVGDATVTFTPADNNPFYFIQEDTPLYLSEDTNQPAKTFDPKETYYFQISYYDGKDKKTAWISRSADLLKNYTVTKNGQLYMEAGAPRLGLLNEFISQKAPNTTNTAAASYYPTFEGNPENGSFVIYLGNNGKTSYSVNTPTTNTYTLNGDTALRVTKTLTGRDWTADDNFTFRMEAVTSGAPMPTGGNTITIGKPATGDTNTGSFGNITFQNVKADDTFQYKITEEKGNLPNLSYDTNAITVTVQFVSGSSGLTANVSYSGGTNGLAFTNTYLDPGKINITPANLTIYMGGDKGYDAVVGSGGMQSTNSLPEPLFKITAPNGVDVEDLLFQSDENVPGSNDQYQSWTAQYVGNDGQDRLYRLNKVYDLQNDVRVRYVNGNTAITNDQFNPLDVKDLFTDYDIELYIGGSVTAFTPDGNSYSLSSGKGKLRVRAVENTENGNNPVYGVTDTAPSDRLTSGTAAVVAPANTYYLLNDTTVRVASDGVGLLFDDIYDSDNGQNARLNALKAKADQSLGTVGNNTTRHYEAKYLDLVDANNGNAWVKTDNGASVTVYWAYPEGTDKNTEFTLLHFAGLHRDTQGGSSSGYDIPDIEAVTPQIQKITNEDTGISFDVPSGGFSPFVLVWETTSSSGGGHSKPDDLNTEDHFAYIIGYPKDYQTGEPTDDESRWPIEPQGDITRAEVATIFFRMLTDEARSANWSQTNAFTDVASTDWYNNAISTLANMGILSGDPDGSFRPNDSITRAEFTKIAVSFFDEAGNYVDGTYADVPANAWYADFIDAAVDLGLIEGYPDGTIHPEASITRAEACTIVNRTLGRVPDKNHLLPTSEMRVWPDNRDTGAWYYAQMQEATNSHDYEWTGAENNQMENWTEKLEDRDWAALEKEWSDANSAPGGEVMD